jgi:hypothetical protein
MVADHQGGRHQGAVKSRDRLRSVHFNIPLDDPAGLDFGFGSIASEEQWRVMTDLPPINRRCARHHGGPRSPKGSRRPPMPTIVARAAYSGAGCPFDTLASYQPRRSPRSTCATTGPPRVAVGAPRCRWKPQDNRAARGGRGVAFEPHGGLRDSRRTPRPIRLRQIRLNPRYCSIHTIAVCQRRSVRPLPAPLCPVLKVLRPRGKASHSAVDDPQRPNPSFTPSIDRIQRFKSSPNNCFILAL